MWLTCPALRYQAEEPMQAALSLSFNFTLLAWHNLARCGVQWFALIARLNALATLGLAMTCSKAVLQVCQ